jgi:hypothetical protein
VVVVVEEEKEEVTRKLPRGGGSQVGLCVSYYGNSVCFYDTPP